MLPLSHSSFVSLRLLLPLLLLAGCGGAPERQVYDVRGLYVSPAYGGAAMLVDHEEIPGYMEPMRMTLKLADPAELLGIESGDKIRFDLVVTEADAVVENVEVLPPETELDLADEDAGQPSPETE